MTVAGLIVLFGVMHVSTAAARGRIQTDGLLTVGGQETVTVSGIPKLPHLRLSPKIAPPPTATACNQFAPIDVGFFTPCISQPLYPVPGTPPLRRNKKGRGALTFVMPAAYEYIDFHDPTQSHPVTLVDGQTVYVTVEVIWKPKSGGTAGSSFAAKSVVVQVPPTPAP